MIHVSFFKYSKSWLLGTRSVLECKVFDLLDLEEALDFSLDVHTKFAPIYIER